MRSGLKQRHLCPSHEPRCRPDDYLLTRKERVVNKTYLKTKCNTQASVEQSEANILHKCLPAQAVFKWEGWCFHHWPQGYATAFTDNSSHYSARFQTIRKQDENVRISLLKHLSEDTLKILKAILNTIWSTGDFPCQWRAANVIPIPKPKRTTLTHSTTCQSHWPVVCARSKRAWSIQYTRQKPVWLQESS